MSSLVYAVGGLFSLHANATYGRLHLVRACLTLGRADVNGVWTELATTPLHAAAYNGHLEVVAYLHAVWAANPIALSKDGWTSLHCAAMNGFLPVVRYLIEEARVRTTIESNAGWTCLHCSAANGFLPVVKFLVETQHMDPDFTTYDGWTALHWACCNGYLNVAKYLLSSGKASALVKTSCGSTILHCAARQGHAFLVQYLLAEGATEVGVGATTDAGNLPLSLITATNDGGLDAFTLACLKGKQAVVEIIVARLGRDSFTTVQLERAHDLHQAAATSDKVFVNRSLLTYLRAWMQELEYQDALVESVSPVTMRELLSTSDEDRHTARGSSIDDISEADELEDDADSEEDDSDLEEEARHDASPPNLDNAHLARSALTEDSQVRTTAADETRRGVLLPPIVRSTG